MSDKIKIKEILKCCPFCKASADYYHSVTSKTDYIRCRKCGCGTIEFPLSFRDKYIKIWNSRKDDPVEPLIKFIQNDAKIITGLADVIGQLNKKLKSNKGIIND